MLHMGPVFSMQIPRFCIFIQILTWSIGQTSALLQPFVSLTLTEIYECKSMLEFIIDFRINMHSFSGTRIDGLTVLKEPYKPFKGGRNFVRSGKVQLRLSG
jgi:AP-3 complex subunit mu